MDVEMVYFNEEVEYDEGGIHYICFSEGEIGLFDYYYSLPQNITRELDKLCKYKAEFELMRVWDITENYDTVIELLKKNNIAFVKKEG